MKPISKLSLSPRIERILAKAGIDSVEELAAKHIHNLWRLPGLGSISEREIKRKLSYLEQEIEEQTNPSVENLKEQYLKEKKDDLNFIQMKLFFAPYLSGQLITSL